jgi:hypothetical protein
MSAADRLHPGETRHEYHLIEERSAAFDDLPPKTTSVYTRREAYKRVHWTLAGHLRGQHGWRRMLGRPLTLDELRLIHDDYHREGDDT